MQRTGLRFAAVVTALVAMTGCEHAMLEDTIFDREYVARNLSNEEKVLRKKSFKPSQTCVVKAYRYSTIGKVECYAHPQEEER